jgi:uncharacterized caspase-like protein
MMVVKAFVAGLVVLVLAMATSAAADKRVALVIGNSDYAKAGKLPNASRDAGSIGALFRVMAFDVVEAKYDLGVAELRRALRDFSEKVRDADIAVVFYAGHGIEINGVNYLVPIDAVLERDVDVEDETVSLDRVVRMLEQAKRLRLVILDACRDNPLSRSMKRSAATRSIGRGLAKIDDLASDTLIAYAAKAGSTAADGVGTNSPYTTALVKHLALPGLDLRLALGRVRDEVLKSTANRQEPFVYGSLGGAEISLSRAAKPEAPRVSTPVAVLQREEPAAPAGEAAAKVAGIAPPAAAPAELDFGDVLRFEQPIAFADPALGGRSLKQLLTEVQALHSPVTGLPEQLWKQSCAGCHNWDQAKLCDQGKSYIKTPDAISRHPHPFGSPFKVAVMKWARNGCK